MNPTVSQVESEIRANRLKLDAWLLEAYSTFPDRKYYGEMDASYCAWHEIEAIVGRIFDERLTTRLEPGALESLLFFISRSDEIGAIIAWLAPGTGTPFSWIGNLSYDDFLFLCRQSLVADDDFCDYQLVACFQKLAALDQENIRVLRQYFDGKSYSYTRRLVVHTLAKFQHEGTVELVRKLWATDDCEFAKLSCLYALEPFPEASGLFAQYLAEYERCFPVSEADYREPHLERLRRMHAK